MQTSAIVRKTVITFAHRTAQNQVAFPFMNTPNSGFKLRLDKLSAANLAFLAAVAIVLGLGHQSAQAQPYYWDTKTVVINKGSNSR